MTIEVHGKVTGRRGVIRKPKWLKRALPRGDEYGQLSRLMAQQGLHTVCVEAKCPNVGECWSAGVAVLMILGDTCTRSCGFCHVKTGRPGGTDKDEPRRVAEAVKAMGLKYVVITSVDRDDLSDGGASVWAETIQRIKGKCDGVRLEVLIPDFGGNDDALEVVMNAGADVIGHNLETVKRLHRAVRPQAKYERSIKVLRRIKERGIVTKTGIMVGLGESDDEVYELMADVIEGTSGGEGSCDILTIGQYLQPTVNHLAVKRYVEPSVFEGYKERGEAMGFGHVEAGPLVRSSYHADRQARAVMGEGEGE